MIMILMQTKHYFNSILWCSIGMELSFKWHLNNKYKYTGYIAALIIIIFVLKCDILLGGEEKSFWIVWD